jgi:hypothetical protein
MKTKHKYELHILVENTKTLGKTYGYTIFEIWQYGSINQIGSSVGAFHTLLLILEDRGVSSKDVIAIEHCYRAQFRGMIRGEQTILI